MTPEPMAAFEPPSRTAVFPSARPDAPEGYGWEHRYAGRGVPLGKAERSHGCARG